MRKYEIEVDVTTVFRCTLDAESELDAKEQAEKLAYQDTWGNTATFGGCSIFKVEEIKLWVKL